MNLKEIRTAMFAQADWAPTQSPEAASRVNNFINRAYNQLALEAPFLFFESKVHLATEPDVTSLDGVSDGAGNAFTDTVRLAGANTLPGSPTTRDPWTWRTTYTSVTQAANPSGFNAWKHDRSWDGRMIEITTTDGTKLRNQIRSVWKNASDNYYYFTLVTPWDIGTYGNGDFKYRIFTEAYPLPDDLIELKSARLRDEDINYPLDVFGQREAENYQLDGPPSQVTSGIPRVIFRRNHLHLQGPSVAPVADLPNQRELESDDISWLGPEPPGTFEYKVTYTWGKRDVEYQLPGLGMWDGFAQPLSITNTTTFPSSGTGLDNASANRFREPRFESPASPASNSVTVSVSPKAITPGVRISLPNITYALGYLNSIIGASSYSRQSLNQSGLYIRIYRKRTSTNLTQYGEMTNRASGLQKSQLDAAEDFYLLAETRAESTNAGLWIDRGEIIPDYSRRLRDIHGYQSMQFYPKPDKRYPVEVRAVVRPQELVADTDTPLIHAEAINVLIERAMVYLYENMGNPSMSQVSNAKYMESLLTLSKRYGDLRPPAVPVLRTMTRATGVRRNRRWNRRLTTDDLGGVVDG